MTILKYISFLSFALLFFMAPFIVKISQILKKNLKKKLLQLQKQIQQK